ncbi:MAG TPA: glycosyltransferase family 4 protein [Ktedonobacterales bacterium]|nr:glycosyltransferase family 4 protein [Ktedonobacterales bacterium]
MSQSNTPAATDSSATEPAIFSRAADLSVALVGWMVAGIRTHYANVTRVVAELPEVRATAVEVHPWRAGGAIERLPLLPQRLRSTLRTYQATLPIYRIAPVDVIWSQVVAPLLPYLLTAGAWRHTPLVLDVDSSPRLLASFGAHYAEQVSGPARKRQLVDRLTAAAAQRSAAVVCWSEWAARSYAADYGVARERLRVLPPGVDVAAWAPPATLPARGERLRLLFVGADFARKGGDLLLDVWRHQLADLTELHLVTKADIASQPGVNVYRTLSPNDRELRALYHYCDALVLPTRGDCFSLASIEAMAAGLPVITTTVGGIPEIVEDEATGYLIAPNDGAALRLAVERLAADGERRAAMGARGRAVARERFDDRRNTRRLLDVLAQAAGR